MKVMIRSSEGNLSAYVPKKDLEEEIVELQHEQMWGGWARLKNGWVLELPEMDPPPRLPITVNVRVRREDD